MAPSKRRKVPAAFDDDTPKAFKRLMDRKSGTRRPAALDDGEDRSLKTRSAPHPSTTHPRTHARPGEPEMQQNASSQPLDGSVKIQVGETLRDFSARVDQALPLPAHSRRTTGQNGPRSTVPLTKGDRKIRRMQDAWRAEEERLREKEREDLDAALVDKVDSKEQWLLDERDLRPGVSELTSSKSRKRKKKKTKAQAQESIPSKAARPRFGDVVTAPPQLVAVKERLRS